MAEMQDSKIKHRNNKSSQVGHRNFALARKRAGFTPSLENGITPAGSSASASALGIYQSLYSSSLRPGRRKAAMPFFSAGFTFIEVLVSIALLVALALVIASGIAAFRESAALDQAVDETLELLREARSKTLGSQSASSFGVHFASSSMTLFKSWTYTAGDPANLVITLPAIVEINAIVLSTTTANVVFERLSGAASATGTISFTGKRSAKIKQIEILSSGAFRKL